jgi:hypothetical protein
MAKKIVVSGVASIESSRSLIGDAPRITVVAFEDGSKIELPDESAQTAAWQQVLSSAKAASLPVYAETSDDGSTLSKILIPLLVLVIQVTELPGGDLEIDLEVSHARHYLRHSQAGFDELAVTLREAKLSAAPVLVTEEDNHEIIDVRFAPSGESPPPLKLDTKNAAGPAVGGLSAVPLNVAQQMFNLVALQTCDPTTVPPPCIPFLYPDDGCWGRAHEMARLMGVAGQQPRKVWIYGRLQAASRNSPNCAVYWGWHVATTLEVQNSMGGSDTFVIDPSLFGQPVLQAQWAAVQGDPSAVLVSTAATIFYRSSGGGTSTDPSYFDTGRVLTTYRLKLQLRASGSDGPPPYARCP